MQSAAKHAFYGTFVLIVGVVIIALKHLAHSLETLGYGQMVYEVMRSAGILKGSAVELEG